MAKVRFKKDTQDSFFGHFLYEQVLPRNHFLVRARTSLPWKRFTAKLLKYYKGAGEYGRTAYEPAKMLRMLLLSFLYNITERETEEFVNLNLAAKYFVSLGVDEHAPDHSSLTIFKERIVKAAGIKGYEAIFNELLRIAMEQGITFGAIQTIDSVHTVANVNCTKDKFRQEKKDKPPRDPDARWGVKKVKKIRQADGTLKEEKDSFYGYKTHVSKNAENGLVTSLTVTGGEAPDNEELPTLVNKDRKLGIAKEGEIIKEKSRLAIYGGTAYTADKAYDDGDNHEFLKVKKLQSAIILKDTRTNSKQEENNQLWQEFKDREIYQEATRLRYTVEQPFGLAKHYHGFSRCRYLGKTKMAIQSYLTFMVLNLKRIVNLTEGVSFRNNQLFAYAPLRGG